MAKNLISKTANDLADQIEKVKNAKGAELEREVLRMQGIRSGASGIKEMADVLFEGLRMTSFLPDDNFLLSGDETRLINAGSSMRLRNTKKNGSNFIDEFTRK